MQDAVVVNDPCFLSSLHITWKNTCCDAGMLHFSLLLLQPFLEFFCILFLCSSAELIFSSFPLWMGAFFFFQQTPCTFTSSLPNCPLFLSVLLFLACHVAIKGTAPCLETLGGEIGFFHRPTLMTPKCLASSTFFSSSCTAVIICC